MAASEAILAYDVKFSVETAAGSGVFFELAEVTDVTPPNAQVDQVEVTHMQSPDRAKEFISGLTDYGDMSLGINWIPGSDTDDFILAWRASGEKRSCRVTWPELQTDTFPGFVTGFTPSASVGDKMSATLTIKVAGAIVRA